MIEIRTIKTTAFAFALSMFWTYGANAVVVHIEDIAGGEAAPGTTISLVTEQGEEIPVEIVDLDELDIELTDGEPTQTAQGEGTPRTETPTSDATPSTDGTSVPQTTTEIAVSGQTANGDEDPESRNDNAISTTTGTQGETDQATSGQGTETTGDTSTEPKTAFAVNVTPQSTASFRVGENFENQNFVLVVRDAQGRVVDRREIFVPAGDFVRLNANNLQPAGNGLANGSQPVTTSPDPQPVFASTPRVTPVNGLGEPSISPGLQNDYQFDAAAFRSLNGLDQVGISGAGSYIKNASHFAAGTQLQNGVEASVAEGDDSFTRAGFAIDVTKSFGTIEDFGDFRVGYFVSGRGEFAAGGNDFFNSVTNGVNGVTFSGLTFNQDFAGSTGVGSGFLDDGVEAFGTQTNVWGRLQFGGGVIVGLNENPENGSIQELPKVSLKFQVTPFFERLEFDANSTARITRLGVPLAPFEQTNQVETVDNYFGTSLAPTFFFQPTRNVPFILEVGGRLDIGLQYSKAQFSQETNNGMVVVSQKVDFSETDFFVGGGAHIGASYDLTENVRLGFTARYDILPQATGFDSRDAPLFPEGTFSQSNLDRVIVEGGIRLKF